MPLRVGVIGTGVMGADHVQTLVRAVPGAEVVAVSDLDPGQARRAAEAARGARVHEEPGDLIRSPAVDAVLVASPDETHEALVLACLEAAKPVLCEKPLAGTAVACLRLVEAEVALGRRLVHVGFMRRFDPGYLEMRRVVRAGTVGRPLLLHCVHRNQASPRSFTSAKVFTSTAVHEIDLARWLLGQEVTSVTVHTPRRSSGAPAGLQDPRFVVLGTSEDVIVDVEAFVNARYGYDIRCELVGELGSVTLPAPPSPSTRVDGAERRTVPGDWLARFAAAYANELRAWAAGEAGVLGAASAWDGYAAQAVAEACQEAAAGGRTVPVNLPPRPALYD